MEKVEIIPPEGYEIDKEKSSQEKIYFKKKNSNFLETWESLRSINGYYVSSSCEIREYSSDSPQYNNKNTFPSKATANAGGILLPMLLQLRNKYRQGWKPDWYNLNQYKYYIQPRKDELLIGSTKSYPEIFAFQSKEIAQQFLDNFRNMLKEYFNALTE